MHNILFPICNIVFNEATRLATEAICSSHKGIVRLIFFKKEKKKISLKLLQCIHTKLAWMHVFMYSLAHCGISGFKMYGTSHLKCSSPCVWAIKQQWRGEKLFGQVRTEAGLGLRQPNWSFDTFWVICLCSFWQVCLRLPSLHKKKPERRGAENDYTVTTVYTLGGKMTSNFRESHKEAWISASTRAFVQRVTW